MKIKNQGLLFLFTLSLSILYVLTIDAPHRLKFITDLQIIPLKDYNYNGCLQIALTLDNLSIWQTKYGNGDCKWTQ